MSSELQHLIDRIQGEAIEQAKQEADSILDKARKEAAQIVKEARHEAESLRKDAEKEAAQMEERGKQALQQAARDVMLTLQSALDDLTHRLVQEMTSEAANGEQLTPVLERLIERHLEGGEEAHPLQVILGDKDQSALQKALEQRFSKALEDGRLRIEMNPRMGGGFHIRLSGDRAVHDFSTQAMSKALAACLRPRLASIVQEAASELSAS